MTKKSMGKSTPKKADSFFRSTEKKEEFKRQTYYISKELIDALQLYKAFEDEDISLVVRKALYEYIPDEYIEKAKEKQKKYKER